MKSFILVLCVVYFSACAKDHKSVSGLTAFFHKADSGRYRFLALGDSYTIGQSVKLSQSFPYQLKNSLSSEGIRLKDPDIIAVTGWTTSDLQNAINEQKLDNNYDVVTLLIGVNNQFQGMSQDDYRISFRDLLKRAIAFAGKRATHVFVLSIPDYGITPFAQQIPDPSRISKEIDQFNALNREETKKQGAIYVDITPVSRKASSESDLIANDGLHPSAKMYALWVEQLQPAVANEFHK